MKETEIIIRIITPQSFKLLSISLSIIFIFIVSGCVTQHALDLAEKKSSPYITYKDWYLKKVRSAIEQENGDISVVVELYESHKSNKSKCYEITLPNSSILKETSGLESLGFMGTEIIEHPDKYAPDDYFTVYSYPLVKAKKGCQEFQPKKLSAVSLLPIVKLALPEKGSGNIYTLLNEAKENGSPNEKLYEVTFLKGEEDSSAEMNETESEKISDVLLIYWSSETDQGVVQPLGIAGGYESENESTYLYYLFVPPTVVLDLILLSVSGHRA